MWRLVIATVAACGFSHGTIPGQSEDADVTDNAASDGDRPPMASGVIARWEFDETGGGIAFDTSNVGTPLDLSYEGALVARSR